MKHFAFILLFLVGNINFAQELSATSVLDKAIAFHDPEGNWGKLKEKLFITMNYPDGRERVSEIEVDMPKDFFRLAFNSGDVPIEHTLDKGECTLKLNGSTDISEEVKKEYRLTCDRARMMKDYYLYLYGLPMKLKDKGTNLDPTVITKTFKGKAYNVLKVTYDAEVGDDIWYFYFDPTTYAMEVYQFFHDESKNDGEYILLKEMEEVNGIKMPKIREWYYNKDNKHLGTDVLQSREQ
ncbi:MAG: DUF6503 family protein [Bacteroidota bacterium]